MRSSDPRVRPLAVVYSESIGLDVTDPTAASATALVMDELLEAFSDVTGADRAAGLEALVVLPSSEVEDWFTRRLASAEPSEVPVLARLAASTPGVEFGVELSRAVISLDESPARTDLMADLAQSEGVIRSVELLQESERLDQRLLGLEIGESLGHDAAIRRGLDDPAAEVRLAAVESAAARSVDRFGDGLARLAADDPSVEVRVAAAGVLESGDQSTRLEAARRALAGPDAGVRALAVGLLGHGGVDEVLLLDRGLDDESIEVVSASARVLAASYPAEAPAMLWRALVDHDRSHQAVLLGAMDHLDADALTATLHRAVRSDDARERALGLQAGARRDPGEAMTRLLHEALSDPAVEVRLHAFESLAGRLDAVDVDVVGERVQDPAPAVRLEAVRMLRSLADDRSFDALLIAAGDPVEHICTVARAALLDRRGPGLVDDLLRTLSHSPRRRTARDLLIEVGEPALEPMLDALGTSDDVVRAEIGSVLRAAGHSPSLVVRLERRDPGARERALAGLEVAADPESVPAVCARLSDPVPAVRARAISVLAALEDPRAIEPLREALVSDPDLDLVPAIEQALRSLGADDLDDQIIELRSQAPAES